MKTLGPYLLLIMALACREAQKDTPKVAPQPLGAQEIVDRAIAFAGGEKYRDHQGSFQFRDHCYTFGIQKGKRVLKRKFRSGTDSLVDVMIGEDFQRYLNGVPLPLPDSMANKYANSVNSVHYFVRLPHGLNDRAVNKELLGLETLGGKPYHKLRVTFDQAGGGEDYEDTYLYWIDPSTYAIDYLAYDFHVDGGGQRFRKAYNPRFIGGIRFVDYENYAPQDPEAELLDIGLRFEKGELRLLSRVELTDIEVRPED